MIKMKEKYKKMNGLKIRQKRKWVYPMKDWMTQKKKNIR